MNTKNLLAHIATCALLITVTHTLADEQSAKTNPAPAKASGAATAVIITTSAGPITVELWPDKAPMTVSNFLNYVDTEFYNGLIFHRVMDGFMIQGGGFTPDMQQKEPHPPVKNEARSDTPNARGTIAMARTPMINSATSQFFINLVDNEALNHRGETRESFGYCAFGKVTAGMDAVDTIAKTPTGDANGHQNVPRTPVLIISIKRAGR